jgi:hypothetical protein
MCFCSISIKSSCLEVIQGKNKYFNNAHNKYVDHVLQKYSDGTHSEHLIFYKIWLISSLLWRKMLKWCVEVMEEIRSLPHLLWS